MTFDIFNFHPQLVQVLKDLNYHRPTPVQEQAIPGALQGRDILGLAQTGSGKTAAYLLPILNHLLVSGKDDSGVLILVPTRELAQQVGETIRTLKGESEILFTLIFGGVPYEDQLEALGQHPDIIVATPGRLTDMIRRNAISLQSLGVFVLDEADRMLDLGFNDDLTFILSTIPEKRQSMMFSATMPADVLSLASRLLVEPVSVSVDPVSSVAPAIEQKVYYIEKQNKPLLLLDFLRKEEVSSAIVFTRTRKGADFLHQTLSEAGINSDRLHSDRSQHARDTILAAFRTGDLPILVATDIAARGIDVSHLTHVFNYELPQEAETYIHRIGRTGRAGRDGVAITFCEPEEKAMLGDIQKLMKKSIPVVENHTYATLALKKALLGADDKIAAKAAKKRSYMGSKSNGDYFRRQKMARKKNKS